jgi:hypothetical protein
MWKKPLGWMTSLTIVVLGLPAFASEAIDGSFPPKTETALLVQVSGFAAHLVPQRYAEHYKYALDDDGVVVVNFGAILGIDHRRRDQWLNMFRFSAALMADSAGLPAGYLHFGVGRALDFGRHSLAIELGPTLYVRENWKRQDWYDGQGYFGGSFDSNSSLSLDSLNLANEDAAVEAFPLIGIGIDYTYRISEEYTFVATIIPNVPMLISAQAGLRRRF